MPTKKQERRWFRVADSVQYEAWTNDELALFVRLLAHLNTRRMRENLSPEDAVRVMLRPGVLCSLTGCQSLVRARRILSGLAVHLTLTVDSRGANTLVVWPKVAEMQGWRHPSTTREVPLPTPTPTPTPSLPQTPTESSEDTKRARAPRAPRRSKEPEVFDPQRPVGLTDETAAALAALHGHDPEAVRRWWSFSWPAVCDHNRERPPARRYRDPQLVARRWWPRAVARGEHEPFVRRVAAEREGERKARLRREVDATLEASRRRFPDDDGAPLLRVVEVN